MPAAQMPRAEKLASFDPQTVELKHLRGQWSLTAGEAVLKNLGPRGVEARQSWQLVRQLKLTQRGSLGGSRQLLEYWLSDGQAPRWLPPDVRSMPIDLGQLRVEEFRGNWVLREPARVLLNFGPEELEARQALAVFRKYGFDRVGVVGQGATAMFVPIASGGGGAPAPGSPSKTRGGVVERIPFSFHQVRAQPVNGEWLLTAGSLVLGRFGPSERDARLALAAVMRYRFTELDRLGGPQPVFSWFLSSGQPPRGSMAGVIGARFQPEMLTIRQSGEHYVLVQGEKPILDAGTRKEDAECLLDTIRRYQFDEICRIGPTNELCLTFFVRSN
jgi:hypothetical protein